MTVVTRVLSTRYLPLHHNHKKAFMNIFAPVSSIMTDYTSLVTVSSEDSLARVHEIFDSRNFHHIPVVNFRQIVGIISRTDFEHFLGGASTFDVDKSLNDLRMRTTKVSELMITRMGKVEPDDRINVVIDIFLLNRFHCLPVVDGDDLVGIVTPYDILRELANEKPAAPEQVYE
jgi:acetoin utilization protein AcuB